MIETEGLTGAETLLRVLSHMGVDRIFSSPGSEWSPVWEALTRQTVEKRPGPKFIESWHETLAVNMASGYTAITGRPQAVLLHAGVGLLQGAMGIHGALQAEVPMVVMSGESQSLGEDPDLDIEGQWFGGLSTGGKRMRPAASSSHRCERAKYPISNLTAFGLNRGSAENLSRSFCHSAWG